MEGLSKDGSIHVTDERINTITSLVGSLMAIISGAVLIGALLSTENKAWYQITAIFIYVLGYVYLFVMSTLHHGLRVSPRTDAVFRTLDYTAIYWLIGGTLTALVAYKFQTVQGLAVVVATWLIAAVGITLRAVLITLPKYISNTFFITLGWLPALALLGSIGSLSNIELAALGLGGILYSLGFIIYSAEKPNLKSGVFGFHELWHILVVVAAFVHWALIYMIVS